MRRIAVPVLVGLAVAGFAACSPNESDFASEAEDFIDDDDGDVATQLGVTFEEVECEEPADTETGTTFTCTATGSDGATWTFTNQVTGDRAFEVLNAEPSGGGAAPTATTAPTAGTG